MDIKIFKETVHESEVGQTYTTYRKEWLDIEFVQDKVITGRRGSTRGFHGGDNCAKLFTCLSGSVVMCVVDIDQNSKTYLQKKIIKLSEKNRKSILVPVKYLNAHQGLESYILLYKWSNYYNLESQLSVSPLDMTIGMKWPYKPILSERDKNSGSLLEVLCQI